MNNEQVGRIYYEANIDTASLQAAATAAEAIAKGASDNISSSFSSGLKGIESALSPLVPAALAVTGAMAVGFYSAANAAFQQVRAVENASFGLRAYEKDAAAVNQVLGSLVEFARSDQGVLFQREELFAAASALKGFGESTANLESRVKLLAQGVAVGNVGFEELAQIMGRSAQQGKLTTEAYDQLAYRGIILDSSLRGAAVGADELYKALDNAIDDSILADRANTIDGLVVRLQSAWRDLGSTILGVDRQTSQFIEGGLGDAIRDGISWLTNFIKTNQQMIISIGSFVASFGAAILAAYGLVKALQLLQVAATAFVRHPFIAVLTITVGLLAGSIMNKVINNTLGAASATDEFAGSLSNATNQAEGTSDAAAKLAKDLEKINRDYNESLAEIVKRHEDSIKSITQQVIDENSKYNAAVNQRLTTFQEQQGKEEAAHLVKTQKLQNQIDFLRRYNNQSNQQQLVELQFALARENAEYDKRNMEREAKYAADANAEKLSYDQRINDLNTRLAEEQGVLNRHAAEVASIRGVILLDEIDKLKRGRNEQIKAAQEAAAGSVAAFSNQQGNAADAGRSLGQEIGNGMRDSLKQAIKDTAGLVGDFAATVGVFIQTIFTTLAKNPSKAGNLPYGELWKRAAENTGLSSRAKGGPVSANKPYFVGENQDGSLNSTSELFVPRQHGTIIPANEVQNAMGGAGNGTTININLSGVMTSSPSDERAVARRIIERFNEIAQAKGITQIGMA